MIENITLKKLYKSDKDKNGTPFKTKDGRPYTRLSIKCKEYGDAWLSGFMNRENGDWVEGQIVEVDINRKAGTDGREFINFKNLSFEDKVWKELQRQAGEIHNLKRQVADVLRNFGQVPDEEVGKVNEELDEVSELEKNLPF